MLHLYNTGISNNNNIFFVLVTVHKSRHYDYNIYEFIMNQRGNRRCLTPSRW